MSYTNTFDGANRITSEVYTNPSGTTTTPYSYDNNSEVTGAGSSTYSYDANGNQDSSGYTVVNNQVTSDGTWNYTYDAVGDLTSRTDIATGEKWTYTYTLNNQLQSATQYDGSGDLLETVSYEYDVFGNLLSETDTPAVGSATVTKWVYDVSTATVGIQQQKLPALMQLDGSGDVTERFLYDPNGNVLARSGTASDAYGTAWTLTDRLGSVRDVLSADGTLQDSVTYDAFGNITAQTNSNWTGNIGFTGFTYSATAGIDFAQNRPYLPTLGQWMVQDPTGLQAGPNESEYAGNDGTNAVDPSGLDEKPAPKALEVTGEKRVEKGIDATAFALPGGGTGTVNVFVKGNITGGPKDVVRLEFKSDTKAAVAKAHWIQFVWDEKIVGGAAVADGVVGSAMTGLFHWTTEDGRHVDTGDKTGKDLFYDTSGGFARRTPTELSILDRPLGIQPGGEFKMHFDAFLVIDGQVVYRVQWAFLSEDKPDAIKLSYPLEQFSGKAISYKALPDWAKKAKLFVGYKDYDFADEQLKKKAFKDRFAGKVESQENPIKR